MSAGRGKQPRAKLAAHPEPARSLFVNSLQKGFAVLKAFSRERPRLTLAQITKITGLDKSAAQRFLYTLHELGFITKDEETKQYSLSAKILEFAYTYLYSDPIIERAQPFLVEVHEKTGETVNLAVLDGSDIILISRIPSRHVLSTNIQIGFRLPAIYSASGRVIAALLPQAERERLLDESAYVAYTPNTVIDRKRIRQLIQQAAADGYAMVESQVISADISAAAPVIDGSGRVVAAVSMSVPNTRMKFAEAKRLFVPAVVEAARKISVALGAF
ncbi:IclR family transcriptional regulator [Rhodoligotrophos defluvii]|uniref:IclR family transcriptional regulator n=1 Tax=Rhodoligotrophos defluvii TaxID=2561934 RepID=UPI00148511B4|nr:IclR family transcriptional regulator C-terminal domain-containing protein [Rhodoligotrophos defluvii]